MSDTDDEQQIRELVVRWVTAVHEGDLDTVLADHADDIVMFDVPPPYDGVRGSDAYRDTWPPFFAWQAGGACFELTELEVTAGTDVAYAYALLRCGTSATLAADPAMRLRLTLGLTKCDGRWVVRHEHHSFPNVDEAGSAAAADEVRRVHRVWADRTAAADLDGLTEYIDDAVVSYEHEGPLEYRGLDAVREVCRRGLESGAPGIDWRIPDLTVVARGDIAVTWGIDRISGRMPDGETFDERSRGTRVFQRRENGWRMIHQHLSHPRAASTDRT